MSKAYEIEFKLPPTKIAWKTFDSTTSVILKLNSGNHIGYGEASPNPIMHDDPNMVKEYLKKYAPNVKKVNESVIEKIHDGLPKNIGAARTAIDLALYDLWGKQEEKLVAELYSDKLQPKQNCMTIFGADSEKTRQDVLSLCKRFPKLEVIKIKLLGTDDIKRCEAVKNALKKRRMSFVIDCNQAYKTANEAEKVLSDVRQILGKVILIEEPTPTWSEMKKVKDVFDIPTVADESAVTQEDIKNIIADDCADGINIKLQKIGGISPARKAASLCKDHGMDIMVGCMFETAFGIAGGIHFAQSTKNCILTDLDFDLQLPDIYAKMPQFIESSRFPQGPGLGVELSREKIKKLQGKKLIEFQEYSLE